jgi:alkylation response protein AidB-like acyl-CoA dehydrogenase
MASICDCARRVGQSAVQAHGGIALTREYAVGHYFKRLTLVERYLGNAEFHLERYISQAAA